MTAADFLLLLYFFLIAAIPHKFYCYFAHQHITLSAATGSNVHYPSLLIFGVLFTNTPIHGCHSGFLPVGLYPPLFSCHSSSCFAIHTVSVIQQVPLGNVSKCNWCFMDHTASASCILTNIM